MTVSRNSIVGDNYFNRPSAWGRYWGKKREREKEKKFKALPTRVPSLSATRDVSAGPLPVQVLLWCSCSPRTHTHTTTTTTTHRVNHPFKHLKRMYTHTQVCFALHSKRCGHCRKKIKKHCPRMTCFKIHRQQLLRSRDASTPGKK